MNREQIIQMAREAELIYEPKFCNGNDPLPRHMEAIERFAAAIRSATKEEDAKICEEFAEFYGNACADISKAIRASK